MGYVLEWLLNHPPMLFGMMVLLFIIFCLWLYARVIWQDGEGDLVENGEETASWMRVWARLIRL